MAEPRPWLPILICTAVPALFGGCGGSTSPTPPGPTACTFTVTITSFNSSPSPAQGTRYEFFFANNVLGLGSAVYLVDVNAAPTECATTWTAVSANTSAVQLSPAGGGGRGQVELFIPPNNGAQRATLVTIAGQTATITQLGR